MGWGELMAWLKSMNRELEGEKVAPDSWKNADRDPWWQMVRREREEGRLQRAGA